jgi:hypothetical protein
MPVSMCTLEMDSGIRRNDEPAPVRFVVQACLIYVVIMAIFKGRVRVRAPRFFYPSGEGQDEGAYIERILFTKAPML